MASCSCKQKVELDPHGACLKCRVDATGFNNLCSLEQRCAECAASDPAVFALLRAAVGRFKSKRRYRAKKHEQKTTVHLDTTPDYALIPSDAETSFTSPTGEVIPRHGTTGHTRDSSGGLHAFTNRLCLVPAWFNVTDLNPTQRQQVGAVILSLKNCNRLSLGQKPLQNPEQPYFFTPRGMPRQNLFFLTCVTPIFRDRKLSSRVPQRAVA